MIDSGTCAHFQMVSDAIAWLVKFRTKENLVNYLDDFLFVTLLNWMCDFQLDTFLKICSEIGMPVSEEKTFRAAYQIVFLGLYIDAINQIVSVPLEKVLKACELIQKVLKKRSRKITVNDLQKLWIP